MADRIKYLQTPTLPKTPVGDGQGSGGAVSSVNGQTGAVTVKTPYYLTVTDNDGTITVDKTPAEIDALSTAGYDVHMRYQVSLDDTVYVDVRYFGVLEDEAYFTGSFTQSGFSGGLVAAIVSTVGGENEVSFETSIIPSAMTDLDNDTGFTTISEVESLGYQTESDVEAAIASALASTQTYFVRGIASAASLLTSSGTSVSYADLVNAQAKNNNVEIKAAMFDLDYNAQFKISEMLFNSQTGKSTVVLTDVTSTKVVVATLTGTGETGALTGTVTTTSIEPELPAVAASDNGKFLRVVNGAWAAQTVPSAEGASF